MAAPARMGLMNTLATARQVLEELSARESQTPVLQTLVEMALASSKKLTVIYVNAISASWAQTVRQTLTTANQTPVRMACALMVSAHTCAIVTLDTQGKTAA